MRNKRHGGDAENDADQENQTIFLPFTQGGYIPNSIIRKATGKLGDPVLTKEAEEHEAFLRFRKGIFTLRIVN